MILINEKSSDVLIALSAILWIVLLLCVWIGPDILKITAYMASCLIITIYYWLAFDNNRPIAFKRPFIYPILVTIGLWFVAFSIAFYTRGATDYFILGLHPGVFWVILLLWLGSFVTLMMSYAKLFEYCFFDEQQWFEFVAELYKIKVDKKTGDYE